MIGEKSTRAEVKVGSRRFLSHPLRPSAPPKVPARQGQVVAWRVTPRCTGKGAGPMTLMVSGRGRAWPPALNWVRPAGWEAYQVGRLRWAGQRYACLFPGSGLSQCVAPSLDELRESDVDGPRVFQSVPGRWSDKMWVYFVILVFYSANNFSSVSGGDRVCSPSPPNGPKPVAALP